MNDDLNPLVSIIIPTFNRSRTIEYCVTSILNQTYQSFEIIIVDDCSTDETLDIVKNLNEPKIIFISLEKNSGAQTARNQGILAAKGDWIAFQDSDDLWEPDKLEIQIQELKKYNWNKYLVIHGDCWCSDGVEGKKWLWNVPLTEGLCHKELLYHPAPLFPTILTSKTALLEINLLDVSVPSYQEWDTTIRLSKLCKFIHINHPLFTYVFHNNETISKNKVRDLDGYFYIVNKFQDEMKYVNSYNQHVINLIIKSFEFKLFDYTYRFIPLLSANTLILFLVNLAYKSKISNRILIKILKKVLQCSNKYLIKTSYYQ